MNKPAAPLPASSASAPAIGGNVSRPGHGPVPTLALLRCLLALARLLLRRGKLCLLCGAAAGSAGEYFGLSAPRMSTAAWVCVCFRIGIVIVGVIGVAIVIVGGVFVVAVIINGLTLLVAAAAAWNSTSSQRARMAIIQTVISIPWHRVRDLVRRRW